MSSLKVIDANIFPNTLKVGLTLDSGERNLSTGDTIVIDTHLFIVTQIQTISGSIYEVLAELNPYYTSPNSLVEDWPAGACFHGKSVDQYKSLSISEKIEYMKELAGAVLPLQFSEFISKHIESCFAIFPAGAAPKKSRSKFGGLPLAPRGFSFPKDKNGRSALFIAQFDVGELKSRYASAKLFNAPGILYFFGTVEVQHDQFHSFAEILVCFQKEVNKMIEIGLPSDLEEYGVFEEKRLLFLEELSIPPYESTQALTLNFGIDESQDYWDFEEIVQQYNNMSYPDGNHYDGTKLLGHPQQLQNCILLESVLKRTKQGFYNPDQDQRELSPEQLSALQKEALSCQHLFSFLAEEFHQLSNFKGKFDEYMDGIFNVFIKKTDLSEMVFDRTVTVYQHT